MKLEVIEEDILGNYSFGLIYVDTNPRQALALFPLTGEPGESRHAEEAAAGRLSEMFYHAKEDFEGLNPIKIITDPSNIEILRSVRIEEVRLERNLDTLNPNTETYYLWKFENKRLLKPFSGAYGVIPENTPYTISSKLKNPEKIHLYPTPKGIK